METTTERRNGSERRARQDRPTVRMPRMFTPVMACTWLADDVQQMDLGPAPEAILAMVVRDLQACDCTDATLPCPHASAVRAELAALHGMTAETMFPYEDYAQWLLAELNS